MQWGKLNGYVVGFKAGVHLTGIEDFLSGCPRRQHEFNSREPGSLVPKVKQRRQSEMDLLDNRYLIIESEKPRGGGFATVRKAFDIQKQESVAVKLVSGASDVIVRKLYDREVDLLKRSVHPNIVRYIDSGIDETDTPYIVLAWVESTIKDLLDEGHPADWEEFIDSILRPIADALAYLHQQSIEHRDVKPGNVLMDNEGSPLLADFGIAKFKRADDRTSMTVADFYSPLYSPPERSNALPFVRDVYSLGVLFIQAITPLEFRANEHHELQGVLERHPLPQEIHDLFASTVDVVPSKRPRNAIEFIHRLDRALEAQRPQTPKARLYLGLTTGARNQIVGANGFPDRADALLAKELDGETFVSFRWDSDTLKYDSTVLFIFGESLRLTVKFDESRKNFVITGVKTPDYDDLDRGRNRALQVDGFIKWVTQRPLDASRMHAAFEMLMYRVGAHHEKSNDLGLTEESVGSELLSGWRRTLLAREGLAKGELSALEFDGVTSRGRESEFTMLDEQEIDRLGTEWQLLDVTGKPLAKGSVVQQAEFALTIKWQWGKEPGPRTQGQLHPFLGPTQTAIDRQRDAIRRIEGGLSARSDLLDLIAAPSGATPPRVDLGLDWLSNIDESKKEAVSAAVGIEDCMVVTGPPGTGKTRFIGETVAQALRKKPDARILIVSQTHVAIDNALERLVESGIGDVVRIGRPDDHRIAESARPLLLDFQLEKWGCATRERAERYLDSRAAEAGIKRQHLRAIVLLEEYLSVIRNREYLESRLPAVDAIKDQTASRIGFADDPVDLRKKIDDAAGREAEILQEAQRLIGDDLSFSSSVTPADVESAVDLLISQSDQAGELLELLKLQGDWLQRISSDDRLAATFLESSRVIAGTCLGFISHRAVRDLTFDLCIVDEASKATSTELLVPLVRSERFILVGDSNQLPPLDEELLRNDALLREHELTAGFVKETLFERLALGLPEKNRFALTEQYRMIAPIGNLISECFYDGTLRSPNAVGLPGYEHLGKAVLWLDTSGIPARRENKDKSSSASYLNRLEADVIFERIRSLEFAIERGLLNRRTDGNPFEVLLIAPYRSQLDELARRLARMAVKPKHLKIEIESVDAVQGREADFALFSVTRSNSEGKLGFLGHDHWRRINVALSRARFGLTIIGDAEFSESTPGGLKRVLSYIRQNPAECELRSADVSH